MHRRNLQPVCQGDGFPDTYGLERISASSKNSRTEYVYDGRGSVIGEVTRSGLLSKASVTAKSHIPFGEQIGEAASGFGYNGEYYNAVTGMVYLRARFYKPEMNRFGQKDILRGSITNPQSLNRYTFVSNLADYTINKELDAKSKVPSPKRTWMMAIFL